MEYLESMNNCETLDGISGEYSIIGKFRLKDDGEFKNILHNIDELMSKSFFKQYRSINVIRCYKESGIILKEVTGKIGLDSLDLKILEILQYPSQNTKKCTPITTIEISQILTKLGFPISQPAVFMRMKRLEENNIILKRAVVINHQQVKNSIKFILRIKINPKNYETVAISELTKMSEISDLYRTNEDYGLLSIIRVEDVEEYNIFLMRLYSSKDILDTQSTLVLDERKQLSVFNKEYPTE
ncbi:MAG: Lrp/AsnC family transcriptional regulator [Candidatus Bathyarchaeota archaeon]